MNSKRFIVRHQEGKLSGYKIIVDGVTGVNYLFAKDGYAGGMTVLLDKDGKRIITPLDK